MPPTMSGAISSWSSAAKTPIATTNSEAPFATAPP